MTKKRVKGRKREEEEKGKNGSKRRLKGEDWRFKKTEKRKGEVKKESEGYERER